jgi:outer membrane biosynthesis protein TonB
MVQASRWLAEQHAADQRRFMHLWFGSFVAHAIFVALLSIAPTPDAPVLMEVLRVDLVASLPAPAPKAAPAPAPAPAPKAAPAPAPKQVLLPKQAPEAVPRRRPPPPPAPARPEPIEYEDALSQLRKELGESTPSPVAPQSEAQAAEAAPADAAPGTSASAGEVDRALAAWMAATRRHVQSKYITPPEFTNRSLVTVLEIVLTSGGELVGMPRVVNPSGDPFFDDNAVRAVMMSAPLPAPPQPGSYVFRFRPEE